MFIKITMIIVVQLNFLYNKNLWKWFQINQSTFYSIFIEIFIFIFMKYKIAFRMES